MGKSARLEETPGKTSEASSLTTKLGMNYRELSAAIGIKVSTLQKMVSGKRIPFRKKGRLVLFIPSEIAAWLKHQEN